MKKKSSPFKSTLTGGILVLSLFSFVFFLIGVFVYKTVCKIGTPPEEKTSGYKEEIKEEIQEVKKDTVRVLYITDTVVVFKNPPAPVLHPHIAQIKEVDKGNQKDTKELVHPTQIHTKSTLDTTSGN